MEEQMTKTVVKLTNHHVRENGNIVRKLEGTRSLMVPYKSLPKKQKMLRSIEVSFEMILAAFGLIMYILLLAFGDKHNRMMSTLGLLTLGVAPICFENIFKIRFGFATHMVYATYVMLSSFLGSCINLFVIIGWYDEVLHGIFGYFSTICALLIFTKMFDTKILKSKKLFILFVISMAVASCWEVMEFLADILLGQDSQGDKILINGEYLIVEGVVARAHVDTMTDMCYHLIGTIIFMLQVGFYERFSKKLMVRSLLEDFNDESWNKKSKLVTVYKKNDNVIAEVFASSDDVQFLRPKRKYKKC
ncbi:MAG: hypothetical protein RR454_01290 [Clostridia bacterium]